MFSEQTFPPIEKIPLKNAFEDLQGLYKHLKGWTKRYPKAFRIDGHHSVGPANPAQWIYFKINSFEPNNFSGFELGNNINGLKWNGTYYLTGSTRFESIECFINLYEEFEGNISKIFIPSYTDNKAGQPSKRKICLNSSSEHLNSGWFCKQYYDRFRPN